MVFLIIFFNYYIRVTQSNKKSSEYEFKLITNIWQTLEEQNRKKQRRTIY